jgi:hypothetical protein
MTQRPPLANQEIPTIYGTRRITAVFKRACNTGPYPEPD